MKTVKNNVCQYLFRINHTFIKYTIFKDATLLLLLLKYTNLTRVNIATVVGKIKSVCVFHLVTVRLLNVTTLLD